MAYINTYLLTYLLTYTIITSSGELDLTRRTATIMLIMMHVKPIHDPMIAPISWSDNSLLSPVITAYTTHTQKVSK